MGENKTIVLDIDGTICSQEKPDNYQNAEPMMEMIEKINYYYKKGFTIFFETSKHMLHQKTTIDWMKKHRIKYHYIFFGKPVGDYYVDGKNKTPKQFIDEDWGI